MLQGFFRELLHEVNHPIQYELQVYNQELSHDVNKINLSQFIGSSLKIEFAGKKACVVCGRKVKKLYQNGYCFPCVTSLAECDLCIMKPHECHHASGTCRDHEFADTHCFIPHYVYLAFSSGFKVGLTRKGRQLTRWVDQGASQAMLFAELPSRKRAGEMEMAIAQNMADKTDWRKMLRGDVTPSQSLVEVRRQVLEQLPEEFQEYVLNESNVYIFNYPREQDVTINLTSLSLDKTSIVEGRLIGVKGQYLLLDNGVFNVKKHSGFFVDVQVL